MKIHLIKGQFAGKDAMDIITKMINIKIKFQEEKIESTHNEEDVKMRETRIKLLQNELYEARKYIESHGDKIEIESEINLAS